MRHSRKASGFGLLVFCFSLVATGFIAAPIQTEVLAQQAQIKVGVLVAVTGPLSFVGDPEAKILRALTEQINKSGGVNGRQINLVLYDTGGDARQATSFARRLIEDDKVDFIIGPSSSGETMAIVRIIEEAKIPMISMAAANAIIEPVKKYVFKTPHSYRQAIDKIYSDMKGRGIHNVGLIAGSGGADQDCRNEAKKGAPAYGIKVVADETHAPADTDMTPQLTKIRGTEGIQAILGCNSGATTVITTRNYKQLGITSPLYFQHGAGSKQYIEQSGAASEGVRIPVPAALVADQLPPNDPQKAAALAYSNLFSSAIKEPPSAFGAYGYDAFLIGVAAIKRAGGTDKTKMRNEIEQTRNYIGATGIFNMTPEDHMGLDINSFKMTVIKGGNFTLLK
jgi:branched-chain amino acid transport system substrate-binding protein